MSKTERKRKEKTDKNKAIIEQFHKIKAESDKIKLERKENDGETQPEIKVQIVNDEKTGKKIESSKPTKRAPKKEKKEKEEKKEVIAPILTETPPAILYLREWMTDRENFKFKKNRQSWLIRHIYNPKMLSKNDFKIMLKYISTIAGKAKDDVLEAAKKMTETIVVTEGKDEKSKIDRINLHRAAKIVELLKQ